MTHLFDASSLVEVLFTGRIEAAFDQHVLDLTVYEVGNALWNHRHLRERLGDDRLERLLGVLADLEGQVVVEPVDALDLSRTMDVAVGESITFYDAAYVVTAERLDATLLTEDGALAEAAADSVEVRRVETLYRDLIISRYLDGAISRQEAVNELGTDILDEVVTAREAIEEDVEWDLHG